MTEPQQNPAQLAGDRTASDYRRRLECIGRFLDREDLHAVAIVEVEGGLLVRATRHGHREPELFEFADAEPEAWIAGGGLRSGLKRLSRDDDLFHEGYAAAFASLGTVLDLTGGCSVTITEGDRFLAVGALYPMTLDDGVEGYAPVADLLVLEDVRRLQAGELPAHILEPEPAGAPATERSHAGGSLEASVSRALGKAGATLAGFASRFGRGAQNTAQRAAAEIAD